jgi:hypothetical protein
MDGCGVNERRHRWNMGGYMYSVSLGKWSDWICPVQSPFFFFFCFVFVFVFVFCFFSFFFFVCYCYFVCLFA